MQMQDPKQTKVIIVTLAETTPVLEAADLQADLRRAKSPGPGSSTKASLPHFERRAKLATWIYRIATNTAIDCLRNKRYAGEAIASEARGSSAQIIARK